MRIWFSLLCVVLIVCGAVYSQDKQPADFGMGLSRSQQVRLVRRLSEYLTCQQSPDCAKLENFLVFYRRLDPESKLSYFTNAQRHAMVEEIRQRPILSFAGQIAIGSTQNFNEPLSHRWWWLEGCAEFNEDNKIQKAKAVVTVAFQRDWRFGPIAIQRDRDGHIVPCR